MKTKRIHKFNFLVFLLTLILSSRVIVLAEGEDTTNNVLSYEDEELEIIISDDPRTLEKPDLGEENKFIINEEKEVVENIEDDEVELVEETKNDKENIEVDSNSSDEKIKETLNKVDEISKTQKYGLEEEESSDSNEKELEESEKNKNTKKLKEESSKEDLQEVVEKERLPKTGEKSYSVVYLIGAILIFLGLYLFKKNNL